MYNRSYKVDYYLRDGYMNRTGDGSDRVYHDWAEDNHISTTIVLAVSDLTGTPVGKLAPLSEVVKPDALDDLLRPDEMVDMDASVSVSFEYEGFTVTARRDGRIDLHPSDDGR